MRVAVIGAGVLGASTAFHLALAGAEVIIIDQAHAGCATAAGAGIVSPWSSGRIDPDWRRIAEAGARYWSFRILGAGARVRRPRSCCFQNSVTQQLEPGAATHGPLDCLQAADLSLDGPRAPR
jgi:glycine/D-amino acid oxidase-like deaminating enzyme